MTWPEKRVAQALSEARFNWKYEWEAVLGHGNGYESVRYPDFYLPETDIYIEVLSLNPTEEARVHLQRKLRFYEENGLDYLTVDPLDRGQGPKSIRQLREEIEEQVYEKARRKYLPYYIRKRYIDDFLVSRDGDRKRPGRAVA